MPQPAVESWLNENLKALGERNADVAAAIRAAGPHPDLLLVDSDQDVPSATLDGCQLASRRRPRDEAHRVAQRMDVANHAVFVAFGFGLGYHIEAAAARLGRAGVILVFEPDVRLLHTVFQHLDMRKWLRESLIIFLTDPDDGAALSTALQGAEGIVAQGIEFIDHPANRDRLGESAATFAKRLNSFTKATQTTLLTTLVRSADTTRNLLANIDHYALGPGIADLKNAAMNHAGIIVSAGPSLRRNMHQLAQPGVRDRCVIIAVQTTLKPLLAAGIKPHFVTALDYHPISQRFYEGLTAHDVEGITLVADPKAHASILDAFPGTVRCCAAPFLDRVLGPQTRDMGTLPSGATVAHLAFYLARHLGCNPCVLLGQDLGFTDGLYYSPGTAIHDVWAPELNPFNTIEMMEWQRIARHRLHLHERVDQSGRTIFTDTQMLTYLQQFERDFAEAVRDGVDVIDATEGGVCKQHAIIKPLQNVLEEIGTRPHQLEDKLACAAEQDAQRRTNVINRVQELTKDLNALTELSRETLDALHQLQHFPARSQARDPIFAKLDSTRERMKPYMPVFDMVNCVNQLGVFKRQRHDRAIHINDDMTAEHRQTEQIHRDIENVTWTIDASQSFGEMLESAAALLQNESRAHADQKQDDNPPQDVGKGLAPVLIAFDPARHDVQHLKHTVQRVLRAERISHLFVIVQADNEDTALAALTEEMADRRLRVELSEHARYGPEQIGIDAARAWSPSAWRSGIAGMSIYDEAISPASMFAVLQKYDLTCAVIVGATWTYVDTGSSTGIDAVIQRHYEHPESLQLVFTQAPPGIGCCLVSRSLMQELTLRNRLSTIGSLLTYQPRAPQADPIARDANVQIPAALRQSFARATAECVPQNVVQTAHAFNVVQACENEITLSQTTFQCTIELTCTRDDCGNIARQRFTQGELTADMTHASMAHLCRLLESNNKVCVTLGGRGDPLCHPQCIEYIDMLRKAGVQYIHVRTALRRGSQTIEALITRVDVVSIDLHADRARTYQVMMGHDDLGRIIANIDHAVSNRRLVTDHPPAAAIALPWIIPRLQRCAETLDDINSFYDRWQHYLGCAIIDPDSYIDPTVMETAAPQRVYQRHLQQHVTIRSDGLALVNERNTATAQSINTSPCRSWHDLFHRVIRARRDILESGVLPQGLCAWY
ncbi:MAG: 6-hydroxymethylpterin diphosphokinase MptE-like protein [Phycisphaerales bacterium]